MNTQTITSANTSINSSKLPAIYKKINWKKLLQNSKNPAPVILDYGAGKFTSHIRKFCESKGFVYKAYDPYNGSDPDWDKATPALIICSNVLNVIDSKSTIDTIHTWIYNQKVPYMIKIWKGNGSNVGKITKKNCYQRNEPTSAYKYSYEIIYKDIITLEEYKKFIH